MGTVLWHDDAGNDVKLRSVSWLIDNALEEIEKSNAKLKGILNRISQYQLDNDKLLGLINTFSDTSFTRPVFEGEKLSLHSKDILGHVYEYFLGQFALAEGKQGGQYYTPKSIVTLIVEMLQPYSGRVYDPAMGSGGFFVSRDKFIEDHASEQQHEPTGQQKNTSVNGKSTHPNPRLRGPSPPLAEDVSRSGKMHHIAHGQEIRFVFELADQGELMLQHVTHFVWRAMWVAPAQAFVSQPMQPVCGRFALGHLTGVFIAQLIQRESTALHQPVCAL